MQQPKPTLASDNALIVRKADSSFKKAAMRLNDRDIQAVLERIRGILIEAECIGRFNVGFLTHRREVELKEGQIKFKTVKIERQAISFLVQPGNVNSRCELWISMPDGMEGKSFLDLLIQTHERMEPEGLPRAKERRRFRITEGDGGAEVSAETTSPVAQLSSLNPAAVFDPDESPNNDFFSEHPREEVTVDFLEREMEELSKRSVEIKRAQIRRDAIKTRRAEIEQTLNALAEEDQQLQQELGRIEADTPNLEAIAQTLKTLGSLLGK